ANGLIGTQARGMIDPTLCATTVARVALGAGDEESQGLGDQIETPVVYIPAIEEIEGPRLQQQLIEKFHIVHPSAGHVNSGRNVAAQVEQGVKFHRTLVLPKLRPGEKGQAQIDGGGIEGVDRLVQFHPERLVLIEEAGLRDEQAGKIGVDAPVALLVGVGQGVARDGAAKAHVIKLRLVRAQAGFDVAQTLAISELGKSQREELIEAGETLYLVVAMVTIHATAKLGERKQVHQLSKNRSATVHVPSYASSQDGRIVHPNSNRFCSFSRVSHSRTCTYMDFRIQHWDSTDLKFRMRRIWCGLFALFFVPFTLCLPLL